MKLNLRATVALVVVAVGVTVAASALAAEAASSQAAALDRSVLPIPEPQPPVIKELDARNVKPPPRFEVKAPAKAPNVVIVLIDDIGFGHTAPFGGPINTPTLAQLADTGLRYNRFHTTALCSPTRTCLLTGRNHHANAMASIVENASGFPGYTATIPWELAVFRVPVPDNTANGGRSCS